MSCKKYVEVTAKFDVDGTVFPLEIQWEDGAKPQGGRNGNPVYLPDSRQGKIFVAGRNPVVYRSQGVRLKIEQQVMKFQID